MLFLERSIYLDFLTSIECGTWTNKAMLFHYKIKQCHSVTFRPRMKAQGISHCNDPDLSTENHDDVGEKFNHK